MSTPESCTNIPSKERLQKQVEAIAVGAARLQYKPKSLWSTTILPTLCALSVVALVVGGFYTVGVLK